MNFSINSFAKKTLAIASFTIIASCNGIYNGYDIEHPDSLDRASGLDRKDYIDQLMPKPEAKPVEVETKTPAVPRSADLILTPQKPKLGINKTVSISVTDDVPIKDVFIELARLADIDIEVDSKITGGVIFKAKNRPFDEVVERICNLAGLRYSIDNGIVKVEADTPYVEDYQANFLNLVRKSTGRIDVDTKTLGNDNSSGSSGGGSGSGNTGSSAASGSGSGSGSSSSSSTSATGSQNSITSQTGGEGDIWASIQTEISAIIDAPISAKSGTGTGASAANATASTTANSQDFVSLNREAGVISVRANAKDQAKVKEYLKKVKDYYSSQVLIEAKVLEISLNDEYRSGVNWSILNSKGHGVILNTLGFPGVDLLNAANAPINGATAIFASGDLAGVVQLAQVFGTTKTLSSPRIQVMNNQQAVLNFSVNENYFTVSCSSTASTAANAGTVTGSTVTSTLHTIPIGIILGLQPAIDTVNGEVSMNVHPTLSRLTGVVTPDPAAAGCNAVNSQNGGTSDTNATTIVSNVPQVDIRELDSILRVKSGEIMAIGGMIDQKNNNTDSGIPYLSEIPILGNAFKTVDKLNNTVQTVILLKATIVPGYGVDEKDQHLYNKFNNDPHPLSF